MKYLYLLFLFSTVIVYSQPSLKWEKYIKDDNSRILFDGTSTLDYGFIIGGTISSSKNENSSLDFFIMKINEDGIVEKELILGEKNDEVLYKIIQTKDGGYIFVGTQELENYSDLDKKSIIESSLWIVKMNAQLNIEWKKNILNNSNNIPTSVYETKDGNYIISGYSINNSEKNNYIYSINNKGDINWYKPNNKGQIEFVKEFNKDILISSISNDNIFFTILNQKGEEIYYSKLEQNNVLKISSLNVNENHIDLYLTAKNLNETVFKKIVFDINLNKINEVSIKKANDYIINSFITDEEGMLFYGNRYYFNKNSEHFERKASYNIEFIDSDFKSMWVKEFSRENDNNLVNVFKTRDHSILLIGNSNKENNLHFLKLSSDDKNIKNQDVEVFPIPTDDYINIIINKKFLLAKIDIYDLSGSKVLSKESNLRHSNLNISNFPSGVYILKIKYDNEFYTSKIIKK